MFYGNSIQDTRKVFFTSWQKYQQKQDLEPVEQQVLAVILDHPEYQPFVENPALYHDKNFLPELGETNPFLHMALHLAVREQVTTNRPVGIAKTYAKLLKKKADPLAVEHCLMEVLGNFLWQIQVKNIAFNEENYLEMLLKL